MMSKKTPPPTPISNLEEELECLYIRRLLVINLIKALEIYALGISSGAETSDGGEAAA